LVNDLASFHQAFEKFKGQFVLKKCRGGYDGYGTYYIRKKSDLEKYKGLFPEQFIAEELVDFQQELAVVLARSSDGSMQCLPLVRTQQTDSRCDWVTGPAKHPQFKKLQNQLCKFVNSINYVGVIAFEIFDCGKKLLINEIAPRVHNSRHYSQNYFSHSQFALHLKCGLGQKLTPQKTLAKSFCMINLLGQSDQPPILGDSQGHLHWYGKKLNRPGRKMGHINYLGPSSETLLKLAKKERKTFKL
jgi:5-(carboxyamino)imidazole ribonucleotide synthase